MSLQILFSPREVAAWVSSQLPFPQPLSSMGMFYAVGFTRRGRLIGGVLWNRFLSNKADVECSIVGHGAWFTRQTICFINFVPFDVFGYAHVTAKICDGNTSSIRAVKRGGWKLEGVQKKAYDGVNDCLLYGLTRKDAEDAWRKLYGWNR